MIIIFERDEQEKEEETATDEPRQYGETKTLVLHNNRVTGDPVPGVVPVSKNLLLIGEPCASYDFTREKSTGRPAKPRTNCWETPVKDRCVRSKMFAMQKLCDKKPLKALEAAIDRPMYNKSAVVPTQTEMSRPSKDAETSMPKCTTDAELAACKVHPFYFAQCRGDPILVEQYAGKKPDRKELVMERARQACKPHGSLDEIIRKWSPCGPRRRPRLQTTRAMTTTCKVFIWFKCGHAS